MGFVDTNDSPTGADQTRTATSPGYLVLGVHEIYSHYMKSMHNKRKLNLIYFFTFFDC